MPTTPFAAEFVTKLSQESAWKFDTSMGAVFHPLFVCCSSPNSLGLSEAKEPVAIIDLDPFDLAFVGDIVNYTGTASYDPDGSIASYAWLFEGHTPSSGTASAGTLNWGTAGVYTVQLTVTDGTGAKSSPARLEMIVLDRDQATGSWLATSSGVYYSNNTTTWVAENSGLSGAALGVWKVIIDPATQDLPDNSKVLWAATNGGVYTTIGTAGTWALKNPGTVENDWADSPAPVPGSLNFRDIHFAGYRLFAMANWQNGSALWRSWMFYTDDAGTIRTAGTAGTITWTEV
jgi:hypothetical protein